MADQSVLYVYCVGPAELDGAVSSAPSGVDGAAVFAVSANGLTALVSALDAAAYGAEAVTAHAGDAAWLTPRAVAHDALVTWASDSAAIVPLPMWVMFADVEGVTAMLAERRDVLAASIDRVRGAREYAVRVAAPAAALDALAAAGDPEVARIDARTATASAGERYLLQRARDEALRSARRGVGERVATEIYDALAQHSRAAVPRVPSTDAARRELLLDSAFLVADAALHGFRAAVTEQVGRLAGLGCDIQFTGPWPAYSFVRNDG